MTMRAHALSAAVLSGVCVILLSGCGGEAATPGRSTPEEAFETARKALIERDWEGMWSVMSDDARNHMADQLRQTKEGIHNAREQGKSALPLMDELGITFADVDAMSTGREWFLAIGPALARMSGDEDREDLTKLEVKRVDLDGDKAVLHVTGAEGREFDLRAERVDGDWRVNLSDFDR